MLKRTELEKLFTEFEKLKIVVIGDIMLDKYVYGHSDRISPEAPVPVVNVEHIEGRLGGAGNVAMNIKAMGATPFIITVTGFDKDGSEINELLVKNKISTKYLIEAPDRITTTKTRVLVKNQQMIRMDTETTEEISGKVENSVLQLTTDIIESEHPDVLIFEDYNKGVLTKKIIHEISDLCNKHNIPIAVDPKKKNFFEYKNCALFKPNLREIKESLNQAFDENKHDELHAVSKKLNEKINNQITMLTLGEHGIYLQSAKEHLHVPAHIRKIADVSGAGDTVISIAALCIGAKTPLNVLAELSNLAGGLVCEYAGVVPIDKMQLMEEAVKEN